MFKFAKWKIFMKVKLEDIIEALEMVDDTSECFLDKENFTFVSCATTPSFTYEGFRLVNKQEIRKNYPEISLDIEYLAY